MIKNSIDFDHTIKQLTNRLQPNIVKQGEILESEKFNTTFKEIEESLNTLYEKTRYLEDSIQYAKTFLDAKVREFNNEMQSTIKELDNLLDDTKQLAYISYNVPFVKNDYYIMDRNKDHILNQVAPLTIKDKCLTLNYINDITFLFTSIERKCDSVPYTDNLSKVVDNNKYQAIYLEEKPHKQGLTETLIIYFPNPSTINLLDFVSTNCNITNIRFGLINGIEEYASDYSINNLNVMRICTYIKFDLVCTNYETITYEIDRATMTDNVWNDIKEFETAKTTNLSDITKLNAECIVSRSTTNKLTGETNKENYRAAVDNTVRMKLYSYIFGLEKIVAKFVAYESRGFFISDYIDIGKLDTMEYISLYVSEHKNDYSCIEYSILDGEVEIPIIPLEHSIVENEPIFNNIETRFEKDYDTNSGTYVEDIIKKDGQLVNIPFSDAINMTDGQYSITYKPNVANNTYTPTNSEIRIKAYIRRYGTNVKDLPYIDMITIRKFGEESLWTNKY